MTLPPLAGSGGERVPTHPHDGSEVSGAMPFVETVDGVKVRSHGDRHLAGGDDEIGPLASGVTLGEILYFTSSDTFDKADYPGLRAVRVKVQGGGGGATGADATTATTSSSGGGGGGGGYAEKLIPAGDLADSETITVGAGGSASGDPAGTGDTSSFGSHCSATGGNGGNKAATQTVNQDLAQGSGGAGGTGGMGSGGDLNLAGEGGQCGYVSQNRTLIALGGNAVLGPRQQRGQGSASGADGIAGSDYGGGAHGAMNVASQSARTGAVGAAGIVILELFF